MVSGLWLMLATATPTVALTPGFHRLKLPKPTCSEKDWLMTSLILTRVTTLMKSSQASHRATSLLPATATTMSPRHHQQQPPMSLPTTAMTMING